MIARRPGALCLGAWDLPAPALPALALVLAIVGSSEADAQDTDLEPLALAAAEAERGADPAAALAAWERVVALGPTSRPAARARRRIEWLRERSEGDFVPLAALMRFRALEARDAPAITAFEEVVRGMPPGRVRIESRHAIATELVAIHEPERAIETWRALLEEPDLRGSDAALAREGIARALRAAGREDEAIALLEQSGMDRTWMHDQLVAERRRAFGVPIATALLAAYLALALALAAPGMRRAPLATLRRALSPGKLLAAAWVTLGPWAIAHAYDDEASDTFGLLAGGSVSVLVITSIVGVALGDTPRSRRVALAIATVLAVLAVGYLVGDREDALLGFAS